MTESDGWASGRSQRLLVPTLMLLATMSPLVSSLGAPLVPQISRLFEVSPTAAQWTLAAPLVMGAVSAPLVGRLGEGSQRRPVVIATLLVVLTGSVLAALPLGFTAFLAGRVMQGAGLGLLPLSMAIARDTLPAERRAPTVAWISISATVGAGLGFPLSALIAALAGIRGAYASGAVVSLVILGLAAVALPANVGRARPVDMLEAVLLGLGVTALLLGITQGNNWGWSSSSVLALLVAGLVLLAVWAARALESPAPMIDLRLARSGPVLKADVIAVLVGASMYSVMVLATFLVQTPQALGGFGLGVFVSGLLMLPYSAAGITGGYLAQRWRGSPERVLPMGCAGFGLATGMLALFSDSLTGVIAAMAAAGLGGGCAFAVLPLVVLKHVDAHDAATALSANHVLRSLGFATGSAVSVTLLEGFSQTTDQIANNGIVTAAAITSSFGLLALLIALAGLGRERQQPLHRPIELATPLVDHELVIEERTS